jgi:GNAT superfamily N-acetyltransferase
MLLIGRACNHFSTRLIFNPCISYTNHYLELLSPIHAASNTTRYIYAIAHNTFYVMTQNLSDPIILHPADLTSNPTLTSRIITLTNAAFTRSRAPNPEKWQHDSVRFPTSESYYAILVDSSVVSLIYDGDEVVACAAAVPWKGGWAKESAGREEGWEIKAVVVSGEERYARKGLAVRVMGKLEEYLLEKEKGNKGRGVLTLWIMAAECINGVYWRKRGYREVRRSLETDGTWGCLTSFELVVLRRDVEF